MNYAKRLSFLYQPHSLLSLSNVITQKEEEEEETGCSLLFVLKYNDLELQSGMLETYMFVNVVRLFAPHFAIGALKPRRAATLELIVA